MPPLSYLGRAICWHSIFFLPFLIAAADILPDWDAENYFIRTQAGLEQNSITALVQSREGYLWIGTYAGLLRFDGANFTQFDSSNSKGLCNGRITKLFEDDLGTLWIGHETSELTSYKDGVFTPITFKSSRPDVPMVDINMDDRGDIWILHGNGALYRLKDGLSLGNTPSKTPALTFLSRDEHRRLWVAINGNISSLHNDQLVPFRFDDGDATNFYSTILPSRDGGLWTMRNGVLRKWRDEKWIADLGQPWGPEAPMLMLETRSGVLMAATLKSGLFLVKPNLPALQFSRTNGLSHDWVRSLCEDREGNIWIGTGGAGVNVLRERRAKLLNPPDGWQGRTLIGTSVGADQAWIGTEGAGLYRYDLKQKTWSNVGPAEGLTNLFIWSLLQARSGDLFVGTWDDGIFKKTGERFERPKALAGITASITALYEDDQGSIWIGTGTGLHQFQDGKLNQSIGSDKLVMPDVRAIAQSPDGVIWFGMVGGGLGSIEHGKISQFQKRDGLGSDFIQALHIEPDNTVWMGTGDNGLCRLKHGKFSIVNADQGLPNNVICSIADDTSGNLWIGTHRGIVRVAKANLERCADGSLAQLPTLTLDSSGGLPSETCSGGFQPSVATDAQGSLWFPTSKGLVIVNPTTVKKNHLPPAVVIEKFVVEGQPVGNKVTHLIGKTETAKALRINPGNQRFEIHYSALSFTAPTKVRFKYRLQKLENEWIDAADSRMVQFSHLPSGDYKFCVVACNNDGLWNDTGACLEFSILPYFWQTLWFRLIMGTSAASLIAFGVLWVTRRKLHHKMELLERQRAIERERTRIARDIHDDLGASLTRITMLSESVRDESQGRAAKNAEQVYRTARETTRALDEIVWAVNPQHDTLDSLASYLGRYAQTFLNTANIRCRLDVPLNLPSWSLSADIRHNVFLAFKEALNNVAKHAHATEVQVTLELLPNGFSICAADNGCGFAFEKAGATGVPLEHHFNRNGICNMQQRLQEIGGVCRWESLRGNGTTVRMFVYLNPEKNRSQNSRQSFPRKTL